MNFDCQLHEFLDSSGKLGRPVPSGQILVPDKVWLADDNIYWRMGKDPRGREVSRDLLNQFVKLTDSTSILRFAQKWGVLALSSNLWSGEGEGQYYLPAREVEEGFEPIFAWQYYAKRARAVLNLAAALENGRLGDMMDWGEFALSLSAPPKGTELREWFMSSVQRHVFGLPCQIVLTYKMTLEEQIISARRAISSEITSWLNCWKEKRSKSSDFRLAWIDDGQRWELQIDYHQQLFPAIALQLGLVVAGADSLFLCSGCGVPYVRPRERKRPKPGWANYCDACSEAGVAGRRAGESYREKKAAAIRLHSEGASLSEIAQQVNTKVSRVKGWLAKEEVNVKAKTRK